MLKCSALLYSAVHCSTVFFSVVQCVVQCSRVCSAVYCAVEYFQYSLLWLVNCVQCSMLYFTVFYAVQYVVQCSTLSSGVYCGLYSGV